MTNPQTQFIGQTFEDLLVCIIEGQEYIGCNFLRCDVLLPGTAGFRLYDCNFDSCNIVVPGHPPGTYDGAEGNGNG